MLNLFDPATTDLLFTLTSTLGLLGAATITLWALPWTDEDIASTEAAMDEWIRFHPHPRRIRSTR